MSTKHFYIAIAALCVTFSIHFLHPVDKAGLAKGHATEMETAIEQILDDWCETYEGTPGWVFEARAKEAPNTHGVPNDSAIPYREALRIAWPLERVMDNEKLSEM
jgi:hypothetical protein